MATTSSSLAREEVLKMGAQLKKIRGAGAHDDDRKERLILNRALRCDSASLLM